MTSDPYVNVLVSDVMRYYNRLVDYCDNNGYDIDSLFEGHLVRKDKLKPFNTLPSDFPMCHSSKEFYLRKKALDEGLDYKGHYQNFRLY